MAVQTIQSMNTPKLFRDFFSVNIGHVATMLVCIVGLVWTASEWRERVALLEQKQDSDSKALVAMVDSYNKAALASVDALKESISLRMTVLDSKVISLELTQKESREIYTKLAALETKMENVKDLVNSALRNRALDH